MTDVLSSGVDDCLTSVGVLGDCTYCDAAASVTTFSGCSPNDDVLFAPTGSRWSLLHSRWLSSTARFFDRFHTSWVSNIIVRQSRQLRMLFSCNPKKPCCWLLTWVCPDTIDSVSPLKMTLIAINVLLKIHIDFIQQSSMHCYLMKYPWNARVSYVKCTFAKRRQLIWKQFRSGASVHLNKLRVSLSFIFSATGSLDK